MTTYVISRYRNAYEENARKRSLHDWTIKEEKFYCCCIPSHLREVRKKVRKTNDEMSQSKCKEYYINA